MASATDIVTRNTEDRYEPGPACLKLTAKQRTFVRLYITTSNPPGRCAADAGYLNPAVSACQLMDSRSIQEALHEESIRYLAGSAAVGVRVMLEIAGDVTHKDRLKAARELIAHAGLAPLKEQKITVEHRGSSPDAQRAELRLLMSQLGADGQRLLAAAGLENVTDAEFEVVQPDPNALAPDGEAW